MSIELQILDWEFADKITSSDSDSEDSDSETEEDYKNKNKFIIRIFGRKRDGKSVAAIITDFKPFFYIKVYHWWKRSNVDIFETFIRNKLPKEMRNNLLQTKLVAKHDMVGFTNNKKFKFVKMEFSNLEAMNRTKYLLKNPIKLDFNQRDVLYQLYESNIMPMLRFIHMRELSASGWIKITNYQLDMDEPTHCDINIIVNWLNIEAIEVDSICPFRLASYDIEADSSHGDFPVAKKNYKKLAMNVIDDYINTTKHTKQKNSYYKNLLEHKNNYLEELIYYGVYTKYSNKSSLNMMENKHNIEKVYIKKTFKSPTIDKIGMVVSKINPPQCYKTDINNIPFLTNSPKIQSNQILIYSLYSKTHTILEGVDIDNKTIENILEIENKSHNKNKDELPKSLIISHNNQIINSKDSLSTYLGKELLLTQKIVYKYPDIKIVNNLDQKINLKERVMWQWKNGEWWLDVSEKENKLIEKLYSNKVDDTVIDIKHNGIKTNYHLLLKKKIMVSLEDDQVIKLKRRVVFSCVRYNDNILKIKNRIEEEYKIPSVQQMLLFNGKELDNNSKLTHYNYFRGGVLHLTIVPFLDNINIKRDDKINALTHILDSCLPPVEGDKVIQIGTVIQTLGNPELYKNIITLKGCSSIEDVDVESYEDEKDVILAWGRLIRDKDPDIITGYNIFGFDYTFIWNRAVELNCHVELSQILGRVKNIPSYLKLQNLSSSAFGDNELSYISMSGRIQMDILKIVNIDHKLDSYKLDAVSSHFINGNISEIILDTNQQTTTLITNNIIGLTINNFVSLKQDDSKYRDGDKLMIVDIIEDPDLENIKKKHKLVINELLDDIDLEKHKYNWGLAKDDVSPKEIFELQQKGDKERAIIAKYCVQDCVLCIHLANKLDIVINRMGMSNVCFVPLSFIFLRGQGIKTTSLVAEKCRKMNYLMPDRDSNDKLLIEGRKLQKKISKNANETEKDLLEELIDILLNDEMITNFDRKNELKDYPRINAFYQTIFNKKKEGYEGAIVLKPQPGIYFKPVTVLDYASLYPSSMISDNLSHDTIIKVGDKYIQDTKVDRDGGMGKYDNLEGYQYVDVTYDNYLYILKGKQWIKEINPEQPTITCRYVQPKTTIVDGKEIVKEEDRGIIPQILNNLLTARKKTRGKIKTEKDPFKRSVLDGLQLAYKITANSIYGQIGASTSTIYFKEIAASTTAVGRKMLYIAKDYVEQNYPGAKVVYGDTDSIFIDYNPCDENGQPLKDKEALKKSIDMGVETEKGIKHLMKHPHHLEYEKTFFPFCLISKKRYVGRKYEFDLDKYVLNAMGIVLKRRDNAQIVKYVYGGIIDRIMAGESIQSSIDFLQKSLMDLLNGKFSMDYLIISKSLRSDYKNPQQIAHKVLADRMGERDPGNKPKSNDRIPYVYIEYKETKGQTVLQGDKVEHPLFVTQNNLNIDYEFYITNQIMKPVCQIYGLIQDKPEKLFQETLRQANNRRNKYQEITKWFQPTKNTIKPDDIIKIDENDKYNNIIELEDDNEI